MSNVTSLLGGWTISHIY